MRTTTNHSSLLYILSGMCSTYRHLFLLLAGALATTIALSGCTGGTEVGEGKVVGTLYYDDGTPAKNVAVAFVRTADPRSPTINKQKLPWSSVHTTSTGEIVLEDTLENGYYDVYGSDNFRKSFADSMLYVDGVFQDSIHDTLFEPGSFTGQIQLLKGHDPRLVDIRMNVGNVSIDYPDENGFFSIQDVPKGLFRVRFALNNNYEIFDTMITFAPGKNDTLKKPLVLNYMGPNLVSGFRFTTDTLRRSVTFQWDMCADTTISSYVFEMYSWPGGVRSDPVQLNPKTTHKTLYLQDSIMVRMCILDSNQVSQEYTKWTMVRAVDLCTAATVVQFDSRVTPRDFVIVNDTFIVLEQINYDYGGFQIEKLLKNGDVADSFDISSSVKDPVSITATQSTLYLLDQPNNDSLCIHKIGTDSTAWCSIKVPVGEKTGLSPQIGASPHGDLFISSNISLFRINSAGMVTGILNDVRIPFAVTESNLYCTMSPLKKPFELQAYDYSKEMSMRFSVHFEDTTVYQPCNFWVKTLSVNDDSLAVVLNYNSLYVFYTNIRPVIRLSVDLEDFVIDMNVTNDNNLYILYRGDQKIKAKIDKIDLNPVLPLLKQ